MKCQSLFSGEKIRKNISIFHQLEILSSMQSVMTDQMDKKGRCLLIEN